MTYVPQGAFQRPRGLGEDEPGLASVMQVLTAFLPKIQELQAASDAAAQQQVDQIVQQVSGGKPTAPATTTASGSTSTSAVGGGDFVTVSGVCKPKNFVALAAAKDFQMQLNRAAKSKGAGSTAIDGAIGPASVSLLKKVSPTAVVGACGEITAKLSALTSALKNIADAAGVPAITPTDIAKAAPAGSITVTTTTGKSLEFKPPGAVASIGDKLKSLPETVKIVGGGAIVLGGILLFKKLRSGRRASSPSASTTMLALPAATSNPSRRRRRRRR